MYFITPNIYIIISNILDIIIKTYDILYYFSFYYIIIDNDITNGMKYLVSDKLLNR